MGNLCVHPGSHIKLFDILNIHSALTSLNQSVSYNNFYNGFNKPELGEPTQVLLRTGKFTLLYLYFIIQLKYIYLLIKNKIKYILFFY